MQDVFPNHCKPSVRVYCTRAYFCVLWRRWRMESSRHTCLKPMVWPMFQNLQKKIREKAKDFKMPLLSKELRSTRGERNQDHKRWFLRPLATQHADSMPHHPLQMRMEVSCKAVTGQHLPKKGWNGNHQPVHEVPWGELDNLWVHLYMFCSCFTHSATSDKSTD